ncbi:cache domain-containing protein [Saccharopolyspora sp. NFXS83]|uniref:PDC sensor domain-containing protein n=1 Tax=Saccharopolyspora sp. NFXS83 TaxID=2993560 RepID=UPI00224B89DB|nr:cache domain-containing protein [Saccharopolyspora sp. NFXS83]MCX2730898.1 cache domain-containing protein [Saccharopolyspora sp. NFXS83]
MSSAHDAAEHIGSLLEGTFQWCAELGERLRAAHEATTALSTEDLSALWEPIFDRLDARPGGLAGTGVILADGVLADRAHWLEWWQHRPGDTPRFLQVDHDPDSVGFYDYANAPWFTAPRDSGRGVAVGPYVDFAGTDEYLVTLAVPVHAGDRFLGVAAADLRTGEFERALLRHLDPGLPPAVLVNQADRVIASNTPRRLPGALLTAGPLAADPGRPVRTAEHVTGLPWRIAQEP